MTRKTFGKKNPNLPFYPAVRRALREAGADPNAALARTTVEARAVIGTKIEIDAIAYKPE